MKAVCTVTVIVSLIWIVSSFMGQEQISTEVTVHRIIDGDTIEVEMSGSIETVRFLGIDCPEADTAKGKRATRYVRNILAGETVTLRFEEPGGTRGYYGRLLAYVIVDGENLSDKLLEVGYAEPY